jgi:GNAT superfamily N-acetyltransferase
MPQIAPLLPADHAAWEVLFRAYCEFYRFPMPQEGYDRLWAEILRDGRIHGLGAKRDGELLGIVHFLPHANTWGKDVCYLEDLFTRADARGQGVARALIGAVTDWARAHGCGRLYWMTHETNATARALYDKVAQNRGFIRYQIEL